MLDSDVRTEVHIHLFRDRSESFDIKIDRCGPLSDTCFESHTYTGVEIGIEPYAVEDVGSEVDAVAGKASGQWKLTCYGMMPQNGLDLSVVNGYRHAFSAVRDQCSTPYLH